MNIRLLPSLFTLLSVTAPQVALAGDSFPLTPQTVKSWIIAGADQAKLTEAPLMVLPAGAQAARRFQGKEIVVNLDAGVVFDTDPANWPVLEIGSAALAFVRNGETGGLSLVLGDSAPITLPYVFKLDPNGLSIDPVHLTFALSDGIAAVSTQQKTLVFPIGFAVGEQSEVVVSAGGGSDLALINFSVMLDSNEEPGSNTSTSGTHDNPSTTGSGNSAGSSASGLNSIAVPVVSPGTGGTAKPADVVTPTPARKVGLVVFSPSAYRLGRADSIRAAAASAK